MSAGTRKLARLSAPARLAPGSHVATGEEGSVRLSSGAFRLELAPESVASVIQGGAIVLEYGVARFVLSAGGRGAVGLPTGAIRGSSGGRVECLLAVARDEAELHARFAGSAVTAPPAGKARALAASPNLFTEIACVEGELEARMGSQSQRVRAAETFAVRGRSPDFAAKPVASGEVRAMKRELGFSDD